MGHGWMITRFEFIEPVSLTSMMRMPAQWTIVYWALLPGPTTFEKIGISRGLPLIDVQLVLDAGADAGVAVEIQFAVFVEIQRTAVVRQIGRRDAVDDLPGDVGRAVVRCRRCRRCRDCRANRFLAETD